MNKLKCVFTRVLSYFPSKLPVGMSHYKTWSDSVVKLIGPIANNEDLQFCIASEVIRLGPSVCSISKNYFVKRVRSGAAKQIAGAVFTEIKENQKAAQKAALLKQAEDTAKLEATSADEKLKVS
jgi:hypothetical protein